MYRRGVDVLASRLLDEMLSLGGVGLGLVGTWIDCAYGASSNVGSHYGLFKGELGACALPS